MGSNTTSFPIIDATIIIDWNDTNLRMNYVTWSLNSATTVRVRVWRIDISPDPISDDIITGPASDARPLPGNMDMVEVYIPEFDVTYYAYPDGLVFNLEVVE